MPPSKVDGTTEVTFTYLPDCRRHFWRWRNLIFAVEFSDALVVRACYHNHKRLCQDIAKHDITRTDVVSLVCAIRNFLVSSDDSTCSPGL